jgi:TonB family protein
MSSYYQYHLNPMLPWEPQEDEVRRFRKILSIILILCLLFGIVIPLVDVPKDVRVVNKVPDRLVKLVIEKKKEKIPPPPPELPKEEKKEEPKPEEKKPEPKPEPKPKPEVKPEPKVKSAKQAAEEKAAVFDVFADLRDNTTVTELTEVSELTKSGSQQTETRREVIGDSALRDSGGINQSVASTSKGGGGALKGTGTTAVTSKIKAVAKKSSSEGSGSKASVRTSENIQLTFDRSQGMIFTAYNRALRKNPSLKGVVVFKLRIEPSGKVSQVSIVSSELNDPALEKRLMAAIKRLDFGAKDVAVWEGNYPVVFAPQ